MEKLTQFAKLLGEDNEKRFKDTLTDKLIERAIEDIDEMGIYLIDFEDMFNELRKEVQKEVKDRLYRQYISKVESKFTELFKNTLNEC